MLLKYEQLNWNLVVVVVAVRSNFLTALISIVIKPLAQSEPSSLKLSEEIVLKIFVTTFGTENHFPALVKQVVNRVNQVLKHVLVIEYFGSDNYIEF